MNIIEINAKIQYNLLNLQSWQFFSSGSIEDLQPINNPKLQTRAKKTCS